VIPTQSAAPAKVTVPALGTPAAVPPPPARALGELVVPATSVQIVGATPELETVVRQKITTQTGLETSQIQLKQDVATILDTGFFANASVSSQTNDRGLDVTFRVEPAIVRSFRLTNGQSLTPELVNRFFGDQVGRPVSPSALAEGVRRTNEWFAQNGYSLARVLTVQPTRQGVVTIDVAEGVVGEVKLRFLTREGTTVDENGNPVRYRTQEGFVRRQILLQPGQVLQQKVVQADVDRLGKLGIFEGVSVSLEGDARRLNVIYNLVEAKSRGFNFGGGYNDDLGLFGTINYQDTNFGGLAQRLSANAQVGTRDVQFDGRFVSPYRATDPNTLGYGANAFRRQGGSRVFDEDIKLLNGDRVRERRVGGGANIEYPIGQDFLGTLGLNYTRTSLRNSRGDVVQQDKQGNPLSFSGNGIDDLLTLSFNAVRDQRNNPTSPSKGSLINLGTAQSLPIGDSKILSNRLSANYAQFIPVDWIRAGKDSQFPQTIGFNLQVGTVIGDLPPYDAYTLGGTNSVRGFGNDDVATSRSYVLASAEYRFPIYRFIGGAAFLDFGSGLNSQDAVLGEPGLQRGKPGFGVGYGLGLRVNSPIGIIRLDFGLNNQGESKFHFGFGQKF
jgi:outer membrane protein insertion porin family